jgi:hypothetical protein
MKNFVNHRNCLIRICLSGGVKDQRFAAPSYSIGMGNEKRNFTLTLLKLIDETAGKYLREF